MNVSASHVNSRLVISLGAAVILLWLAIFLALHASYRATMERASNEGRNLARSLTEHMLGRVQAIDHSLLYLREAWLRDRDRFVDSVQGHKQFLAIQGAIQTAVVDSAGLLAFSELPESRRVDFSDRPYFKVQKESGTDQLHVSEPVQGRVTRQWAIQFTRPIYDRQQQFAGLIIHAIPPPALERIYEELDLGAGSVIALVRADGQVIAHSRHLDSAIKVSLKGTPPVDSSGPAYGEFRRHARVDGVERLYSYRRIGDYPLTVVIGQAIESLLAPYFIQRRNIVTAGAFATVLLFVIVFLLVSRQRREERSGRDRARLAAIVNSTQDVVISRSSDGTIESWNPAAERLFGYAAAEAIGQHITLIVPDDRVQEVDATREALHRGESVPAFDTVRLAKDGRRIDVSVSLAPHRSVTGETIGVAVIMRDITERRQAHDRELEKERQLRDTLVREVHHRVKNALQGAILLLGASKDQHPGFEVVLEPAIARLYAMAAVFGLQAGGATQAVMLIDLVRDVCGTLAKAMECAIAPAVDTQATQSVEVAKSEAVPVALLVNELVFNAIKHGSGKEPVRVRVCSTSESASVRIVTPGASLPPGFDFESGARTGTGLQLVKSMLRQDCLRLAITSGPEGVTAELVLRPPAIVLARDTGMPGLATGP